MTIFWRVKLESYWWGWHLPNQKEVQLQMHTSWRLRTQRSTNRNACTRCTAAFRFGRKTLGRLATVQLKWVSIHQPKTDGLRPKSFQFNDSKIVDSTIFKLICSALLLTGAQDDSVPYWQLSSCLIKQSVMICHLFYFQWLDKRVRFWNNMIVIVCHGLSGSVIGFWSLLQKSNHLCTFGLWTSSSHFRALFVVRRPVQPKALCNLCQQSRDLRKQVAKRKATKHSAKHFWVMVQVVEVKMIELTLWIFTM